MSKSGQDDIRSLLKRELRRRQGTNPRYSLRAFAFFLQMSPNFLSEILSGKRLPGDKMLIQIMGRLKLPNDFTESVRNDLRKKKVRITKKTKKKEKTINV